MLGKSQSFSTTPYPKNKPILPHIKSSFAIGRSDGKSSKQFEQSEDQMPTVCSDDVDSSSSSEESDGHFSNCLDSEIGEQKSNSKRISVDYICDVLSNLNSNCINIVKNNIPNKFNTNNNNNSNNTTTKLNNIIGNGLEKNEYQKTLLKRIVMKKGETIINSELTYPNQTITYQLSGKNLKSAQMGNLENIINNCNNNKNINNDNNNINNNNNNTNNNNTNTNNNNRAELASTSATACTQTLGSSSEIIDMLKQKFQNSNIFTKGLIIFCTIFLIIYIFSTIMTLKTDPKRNYSLINVGARIMKTSLQEIAKTVHSQKY